MEALIIVKAPISETFGQIQFAKVSNVPDGNLS